MIRRKFIKESSKYTIASLGLFNLGFAKRKELEDLVIGHNSHRYKIDMSWGALDSTVHPVNDCHEMVQDSKGRIVLLTNHTKNNVIIYDKKGNLVEVWGTEFPGAHGLSLHVENGKDYLYITDTKRHAVIKTTIDGKVVQVYPCPLDSTEYQNAEEYQPTETAIADNGDIYVADGYGKQHILHYNASGDLLHVFGGRGNENNQFNNAHGICIDSRNGTESLLITARMQNKLKRFSLEGEHLSNIDLPGAYICRPVIHGEHVYMATIWSGKGEDNSGFISILDNTNKLVSAPCGSKPKYKDGKLTNMYQTLKVFQHPHDVCVDDEENLYVAQWNSGMSYPIKLYRV